MTRATSTTEMKTTCIIVEDIQIAADFLRKFCEKSDLIEVKGHFLNVADALGFLDEERVDLIFLDVEMPGANGFELLDSLTYSPRIILTTSKTEYAFDAFQYNVNDYLKKPFTYRRFLEAIQKIQQPAIAGETATPQPTPAALQPASATPALPAQAADSDFLFIKSEDKLIKLKKDDILFLESMRDYVKFVTSAKSYITYSTLKNMEEKLLGATFLKVHRSYIVNITKIDDIRGNIIYLLGNQVPIGKGHKEDLATRLNIL